MKNFICVLVLILGSLGLGQAQQTCVDTVYFHLSDATSASEIAIDIDVENFNNITSIQFTINYDGNVMEWDGIEAGGLIAVNGGSFFNPSPGEARFAWFDPSGLGQTLPDGTTMMTLKFQALAGGSSEVTINDDPIKIEISALENNNLVLYCLGYTGGNVVTEGANLSGKVTSYDALDCTVTANETPLRDWVVQITGAGEEYFVDTRPDGTWSKLVTPGTHTISVVPINNLWDVCVNDQEVVTMQNGDVGIADFTAIKTIDCSDLHVGVSTPFLRRCFDNTYSVVYCNQGTIPVVGATVEVAMDDDLEFLSCSNPNHTIAGQILTVDVGDLDILECGEFTFEVYLSCDAELSATHCVKAEIEPNDPCFALPTWDGSSLEVTGFCDGDSVRFNIRNTTNNPMTSLSSFIVIEDDVMNVGPAFDLAGMEVIELAYEANGSTYRINADQVPDHPGFSMPTIAVEGCGTNGQGDISVGFVNMFPENDADGFVAIDCQMNIGSWDPNDKAAQPIGYGTDHFIKKNTDIEYKIRFQNTGTDTAFRVVIVDELSENLDLRNLQMNASSHPYELDIDGRTLQFTFDNIMLPDSNVNEAASHGFISFKASQIADLVDDEEITNHADIYFDFNEAVVTNEVKHIIGSDFVEEVSDIIDHLFPLQDLTIMPHPVVSQSVLSLGDEVWEDAHITIYDAMGRSHMRTVINQNITISKEQLPEGIYMYKVQSKNQIISIGKLIVQ